MNKRNILKLPISRMAFIKTCKKVKKRTNINEYSKDVIWYEMNVWIVNKKDINTCWGYDIDMDYYNFLYNDLIDHKYIVPIYNTDKFKINNVNIAKGFWNKFIPVVLSAITTLLVNYILSVIIKI
jgi:hypothetical protein